jgi:hypothetical protein
MHGHGDVGVFRQRLHVAELLDFRAPGCASRPQRRMWCRVPQRSTIDRRTTRQVGPTMSQDARACLKPAFGCLETIA